MMNPPPNPIVVINGIQYRRDDVNHRLQRADRSTEVKTFDSECDYRTYLFWTEQLQPFVGQRVVAAEMELREYAGYTELTPVIRFENKEAIELVRDDEGNGAGRFYYV